MSLLFEYMCMRLPFIPWSIAGVPSSQALPGYLIIAPPSVCVPDVIGALACGFKTPTKKNIVSFIGLFCQKVYLAGLFTNVYSVSTSVYTLFVCVYEIHVYSQNPS